MKVCIHYFDDNGCKILLSRDILAHTDPGFVMLATGFSSSIKHVFHK